ncbi:hypothetical protein ACM258_05490 [Phaeobacter piscinae]|uniref:hypothetical protein n=1 Tax=Phaeobacter piscinae TaxID=1580596 RepID=UPI0039F6A446
MSGSGDGFRTVMARLSDAMRQLISAGGMCGVDIRADLPPGDPLRAYTGSCKFFKKNWGIQAMIRGHRIKNCAAAEDRILLIPEGLHDFAGAEVIMTSGRAGIFHKLLYQDAFGTEFLSNAPCLAYVLRGRETFVDADGDETTVVTGDTLLVPRHHHMVSEFSSETGPLEAVLFFFSDAVIAEFLAATSHGKSQRHRAAGLPCLRGRHRCTNMSVRFPGYMAACKPLPHL